MCLILNKDDLWQTECAFSNNFHETAFQMRVCKLLFIYERKIADMAYYINAFVKQNNNVKHINNGSKKSIYSPFS